MGARLETTTPTLAILLLAGVENESCTCTRTVGLASPSGKEHWNVPVFSALLMLLLLPSVPPVPQSGNPLTNVKV